MNNANDIRDELRGLNSPLADMSRNMPYHVPAGYFERLTQQLTDHRAIVEAAEPVPGWPKTMPYSVPQGYFEELPDLMLSIAQEPVLSFSKTGPHAVPEGYFDQLPQQILQKVKEAEQRPQKVIPIGKTIWKPLRWAAAAVLLIGIGFGVYSRYGQTIQQPYNAQTALAEIPQESIDAYVQQHIDEFDADMLASGLETNDIKVLTNKLSDEDIENYLDETSWESSAVNL